MKLLIALGLVAAALAAYSESDRFQSGKEYRFEWSGQVASGLAIDGSSQHSIQQIVSQVYLSFSDEHSVWLRLSDIRLGAGQEQLREPRLYKKLSLEDSELSREQLAQLAMPVRFRYHNGIVSELQFASDDQSWSQNIKRAVINMLQLNLSKKAHEQKYSESDRQSLGNDYFTTQEKTIEGECEVAYTVVKGEQKEIEVTKSLNFDKCTKRVDIRYNYRFGEQWPETIRSEDRLPESQTVINYKISGTEKNFLINEVELKSEYVFSPLSKEQQMLATYVHNKLRLVKIADRVERIEEPELSKKTTLVYNFETVVDRERFWMTGSEESYKKAGFVDSKKTEVIGKLIKKFVQLMENEKSGVQLQATHEMARLVEVLRMSNQKDIHQIHSEIYSGQKYDEKTMKTIRGLLVEALATAGTRITLAHVYEKIANREVGTGKAAELLKKIVHVRVPSKEIVSDLIELCNNDVPTRNPLLKQSCWLTAGALINGVCGDNEDKLAYELEQNKKCTREQKRDYVDIVKRQFQKAESRYEKVLALKVLANAGIDVSVHFLETIIYDKEQEKSIRIEAIDALRQMRLQMPRKIQQILMPLFKSRSEDSEIRMTAVHHIMHTLPERVVIEQVIEQLNKERNQQVVSFTYSLIKSFVRSENPLENKFSQDCEVALRMLSNKVQLSSIHTRLPIHSKLFNIGATADFSAIFNNETVLPKELAASFETIFGGHWNRYFAQIGFTQQNLDKVILKFLNKLEKSEGLDQIVVRGKRASLERPIEYLRSLAKKMNIESRKSESEESYAMVYIRYKNLDYAILPIDDNTITGLMKTVLRNGKIDFSEIQRVLAAGYHFDLQTSSYMYETSRLVATSFGFPVKVDYKMPTVIAIKGMIKIEPDNKSRSISGLRVRLLAKPSGATTHISEMQVLGRYLQNGIRIMHSVELNLPVDSLTTVNWQNKIQLKTIVKTPEVEKRVLLVQTRSATFIRRLTNGRVTEAQEKTVFVSKLDKTNIHYEKTYGEELFGLQMNVFGSVHRHMFQKNSMEALLLGENHVEFSLKPTEKVARELVFEIETALEDDRAMSTPRFENFADSDLLSVEGLEENDSEIESGRRSAFNKYYKNLNVKDSYKNRLVMKAYTIGAPEERKVQMEVRTVCEKAFRYCKMDVLGKRSPLFEESREWELKASVETLFPEMPTTLQQIQEQKHREFQAVVESEWGCEKTNVLKMKIQGEQDRILQKLIKNINWEKQMGGVSKFEQLQKVSALNQYKLIADYEFEATTKKVVEQIYNYIQSYVLLVSEIQPLSKHQGRVFVKLSVEPESRRYVNLTVETPSERMELRDVHTSVRVPLLNIAQSMKVNKIRSLSHSAECQVMSTKVRTFDNLIYKTPLTTCFSVIAKDCSEEPKFAVLLKKLNKRGEEKKIKIVSEDNVIEWALVDEKIVCSVNGQEITDEMKLQEFDIEKINEELYQIVLPQITVRFDGYTAKIQMSSQMQNQQCGLCGHFDGQNDNEFRGAGNTETEDIEEFHRSWMTRDSECDIEESVISEKKNYRVLENDFGSDSSEENDMTVRRDDDETYEPRKATIVLERGQETCFSMEPVSECVDKHQTTKAEKHSYTCLPTYDRETKKLVQRARTEILDLSNYEVSFSERMTIPTMCVAY